MGKLAVRKDESYLRLVVDHEIARPALMPVLEVERRLNAVERELRRPALAPERREAFLCMRHLLHRALQARPFDPAVARRCEQHLRWIELSLLSDARTKPASTVLGRIRALLNALLTPPMARA